MLYRHGFAKDKILTAEHAWLVSCDGNFVHERIGITNCDSMGMLYHVIVM